MKVNPRLRCGSKGNRMATKRHTHVRFPQSLPPPVPVGDRARLRCPGRGVRHPRSRRSRAVLGHQDHACADRRHHRARPLAARGPAPPDRAPPSPGAPSRLGGRRRPALPGAGAPGRSDPGPGRRPRGPAHVVRRARGPAARSGRCAAGRARRGRAGPGPEEQERHGGRAWLRAHRHGAVHFCRVDPRDRPGRRARLPGHHAARGLRRRSGAHAGVRRLCAGGGLLRGGHRHRCLYGSLGREPGRDDGADRADKAGLPGARPRRGGRGLLAAPDLPAHVQ